MPCRPTSIVGADGGEFRGVRTFGQQVKHLAATNYMSRQERSTSGRLTMLGMRPVRRTAHESRHSRLSARLLRALHRAAAAIDDSNAVVGDVPISPLTGQATRLGYVLEALLHTYDHYGQMVIYLRMNGVVPPASRNR